MRWLILMVLLAGCATLERNRLTTFEPNGDDTYTVTVFVNPDYNLNNSKDEDQRLAWVEGHMNLNGACPSGYDVVKREVVTLPKPPLGGQSYRVHYRTACK